MPKAFDNGLWKCDGPSWVCSPEAGGQCKYLPHLGLHHTMDAEDEEVGPRWEPFSY